MIRNRMKALIARAVRDNSIDKSRDSTMALSPHSLLINICVPSFIGLIAKTVNDTVPPKTVTILVACYATLHPAKLVCWLVGWLVGRLIDGLGQSVGRAARAA